jgi:hypothetical protein
MFNHVSRWLYRGARLSRDARAVERSIETKSPSPVAKRLVRKAIGRGFGRAWGGWPR